MTLKTLLRTAATGLLATGPILAETTSAPSTADEIAALRSRLAALEEKVALEQKPAPLREPAGPAPAENPSQATATFNDKGFTVTSADKAYQLRIKGLAQTDARIYFNDGDGATDKFILRRARPILEATVGHDYDIVLVPEFGDAPSTTPFLLDAYLNAAPFGKGLQFRIGKQRSTIGFEMNQADPKGFFTERSLATQLTSNRDLGVAVHGKPFDKILEYSIGVFNGAPDGASPSYNGDVSDAKSVAGRIYVQPFASGDNPLLKHLGFGFGADYRDKTGTPGANSAAGAFNNGLFNYRSDAQQTIFTWNTASYADGKSVRYSPHLGWYAGRFGLLAEYVVSENAVSRGARHDVIRNRAWQIAGSWVLTGENASYEGVTPSSKDSVYNGGAGAWELVARISGIDFDKDAFTGGANAFANGATSAKKALSYAVGVNWYPSVNLRFSLAYTRTEFDTPEGITPTSAVLKHGESALLARAQISF